MMARQLKKTRREDLEVREVPEVPSAPYALSQRYIEAVEQVLAGFATLDALNRELRQLQPPRGTIAWVNWRKALEFFAEDGVGSAVGSNFVASLKKVHLRRLKGDGLTEGELAVWRLEQLLEPAED